MDRYKKEIINAREYAKEVYQDRRYYKHKLFDHCHEVYLTLRKAGYMIGNLDDMPVLKAAWLHHVLKVSELAYQEIEDFFGSSTANTVYNLTSEVAKNRLEQTAKTFVKIRNGGLHAITVKIADRLANVRYRLKEGLRHGDLQLGFKRFEPNDRIHLYVGEYETFKELLQAVGFREGMRAQMWNELDAEIEKAERIIKGDKK